MAGPGWPGFAEKPRFDAKLGCLDAKPTQWGFGVFCRPDGF
jgi:hypothetical protein